ncbi:MAG: glycosyltransferase, partial [Nodosilinea sp.]
GRVLPTTLEKLSVYLKGLHKSFEIIVSDDGSDDQTQHLNWQELEKRFSARYIRSNINTGKGGALRRGLQASCGKSVIFTDADLPVELDSISRCLDLLEENNFDMVVGNRYIKESRVIGRYSLCRRLMSKVFRIFTGWVLPQHSDTQCCLKGFTTRSLRSILPFCSVDSYAVDIELLVLANSKRMRVATIPVTWHDGRLDFTAFQTLRISLILLKDISYIVSLKMFPSFHRL